ncbi:hypothetical protein GGX14DRAFT_391446 [Mycena pura]|uniref:Uncharacterized protein n=1 Tax=Mycena pura TaxID=153505 RepID=A0AAD6VQ09_9AGAR|nr:hypothetical protein GGX14DRAFT_391446 [Mycena pura]
MASASVASLAPLRVDLPPVAPLDVPRRRTLDLPPALRHSHAASSSESRRINSMPIASPKIRPLPQIPVVSRTSPGGRPPSTRRHAPLRPLPSVPQFAAVSVSVTPASPLPPPTPAVSSHNAYLAPQPPPGCTGSGPRFATLALRRQASYDALTACAESSSPDTSPEPSIEGPSPPYTPRIDEPYTPLIDEPPPPRPRRASRLRRHLGESVQLELFSEKDAAHEADVCAQTVVAVQKLLDLDALSDSDSSDDDDADQLSLVLTTAQVNCSFPVNRLSRRWVREKGGKRWVEENYSDILRDLRAL